MWSLYVDYSRSSVGHMYNLAGILVQAHISVIWNVCMLVVVVTLFITLSSYKVVIDIVV